VRALTEATMMMATMTTMRELLRAEDAGWSELIELVESLTPAESEQPGYFPEGWSVKDLLAHIASWQAEAGQILEQIRMGTYRGRPVDVEAMNKRFYEANKDLPLSIVKAEAWAARNRMLAEWSELPELTPEAEEWFRESGPGHYEEHLGRLREWVAELRAA
jgi:hypothetical protein